MHLRRIALTGIGLAGSGAAVVALAVGSSPATGASPQPLDASQIVSIAKAQAAGFGEPNASLIEHITTTRTQADLASSGDTVNGPDQAAVLIVEHGHFVATNAPVPLGAKQPSGTVLTMIVDPVTGQPSGIGIQDNDPDFAKLGGTVTTDLVTAKTNHQKPKTRAIHHRRSRKP